MCNGLRSEARGRIVAAMFGFVSALRAKLLRDDSVRPAAAVGGSTVKQGNGAVYEPARRLQSHPVRMDLLRSACVVGPVRTALAMRRELMNVATPKVVAADESPQAAERADFVRRGLGIGERSPVGVRWSALWSEMVGAIEYGFSVWELVPRQADDGMWYTVPHPRDQATIDSWAFGQDGELVGAYQRSMGLGGYVLIPASQLMHIGWGAVGPDDYSGIGDLRAMEPLASDYRLLSQLRMVAAQRYAVGTPVAVPSESHAGTVAPTALVDEADAIESILSGYASSERGFVVLPAGWSMSLLGGSPDLAGLDAAIDATGRRILEVVQAQWLMLGSGSGGGSWSLGEVQKEAMREAAQSACDRLGAEVTEEYIPRAILWQFGDRELLPSIRFDGLQSQAFARPAMAALLPGLTAAGWVVADEAARAAFRAQVELPEADGTMPVRVRRNVGAPAPILPGAST